MRKRSTKEEEPIGEVEVIRYEISRNRFILSHQEQFSEQEEIIGSLDQMLRKINEFVDMGFIIKYFIDQFGGLVYTYEEKSALGFRVNPENNEDEEEHKEGEVETAKYSQISQARFTLIHEQHSSYAKNIAQNLHNMLEQLIYYEDTNLYQIHYYIDNQGTLSYEIQEKPRMGFLN